MVEHYNGQSVEEVGCSKSTGVRPKDVAMIPNCSCSLKVNSTIVQVTVQPRARRLRTFFKLPATPFLRLIGKK